MTPVLSLPSFTGNRNNIDIICYITDIIISMPSRFLPGGVVVSRTVKSEWKAEVGGGTTSRVVGRGRRTENDWIVYVDVERSNTPTHHQNPAEIQRRRRQSHACVQLVYYKTYTTRWCKVSRNFIAIAWKFRGNFCRNCRRKFHGLSVKSKEKKTPSLSSKLFLYVIWLLHRS